MVAMVRPHAAKQHAKRSSQRCVLIAFASLVITLFAVNLLRGHGRANAAAERAASEHLQHYWLEADESRVADTGEAADRTKNEQLYDKEYWEWQSAMNAFGAAVKGDILRHVLRTVLPARDDASILEFGSSGGHIIAGKNQNQSHNKKPANRTLCS